MLSAGAGEVAAGEGCSSFPTSEGECFLLGVHCCNLEWRCQGKISVTDVALAVHDHIFRGGVQLEQQQLQQLRVMEARGRMVMFVRICVMIFVKIFARKRMYRCLSWYLPLNLCPSTPPKTGLAITHP